MKLLDGRRMFEVLGKRGDNKMFRSRLGIKIDFPNFVYSFRIFPKKV